ncbi:IS1380 family transposase [Tenggerimyces flavus]|uniref:IS1380 family transposase n=1 Tax=Tenggerimyces flavus TaxID=1708749 RepID=A0ABV7YNV2_9ACTN|nr:IS1380 family transposase [Tenggerimyces flavus]
MRVSHSVSAVFDDPNLVSCAGLVPVLSLARRCGLAQLAGARVSIDAPGGANPQLKVPALVAGMVAGADSIDDLDLLRHGGMDRLFGGVRAPSTLGTFLRCFTFGHVRQLDAVAAAFLVNLARHTPLLPDGDELVFVDVDDTIRRTHGHAKQGVGCGYSGVSGLNALLATVSTSTGAPVIAATRLRKGSTHSARGAATLIGDAIGTVRKADASGMVIVRADSAFYTHHTIAAIRRARARFSVTARMTPAVVAAISAIDEQTWTPIHYPNAVFDEAEQCWISDAEVAEIGYTAFGNRRAGEQVTARLIVRRVRRLNPTSHVPRNIQRHLQTDAVQGELFAAYRYHAVFTDSPMLLLQAETQHRGHAIVEQVIADLKNSALAHLPSGRFNANAAWLVCAAIAFNLTRAAGTLASTFHARATTATIRAHLINLPARIARSARRLTLHLPRNWPWEHDWQQLFTTAAQHAPPHPA